MRQRSLLNRLRTRLRMRRLPCVRQHDHNDCGPACLATVGRFFGLELGVGRVRELCRGDAMGTNLLGLAKGAERLGFSAKAAKASYDALPRCPLPLVVHVEEEAPSLAGAGRLGHFCVLFAIDGHGVVLSDPARGVRWVARAEFERIWTGKILLLVPTPKLAGVDPA